MPEQSRARHDIEFTVSHDVPIIGGVTVKVGRVFYIITSMRQEGTGRRVTGRRATIMLRPGQHFRDFADLTAEVRNVETWERQTSVVSQWCPCVDPWPMSWLYEDELTTQRCRRCGREIRPLAVATDAAGRVVARRYEHQEADREERRQLLRRANDLQENIPEPVAHAIDGALAVYSAAAAEQYEGTRPSNVFTEWWNHQFAQPWGSSYVTADPQQRTLEPTERRFMLRHCGRMEAELRWLVENNPTVRDAWNEAKRGGLSETSAAEMALICLARENDDLRRQLSARRLVPVVAED